MSTATSVPAARPAPSQAPGHRSAPVAAGPAPSGFANIDPIRLLRRYWPLLAAAAVIGGMLGVAGHFVLLRTYPTYTSSVTFQCIQPRENITEARGSGLQQADFDRFMGTQMALMTSFEVLDSALKNPDVTRTEWAKQFVRNGNFQPKDALGALQDKLSPRLIPQTTLIRMGMSWRNREDVRAIVDAVARAYIEDVRRNSNSANVAQREVIDRRRAEIDKELKRLNGAREAILTTKSITNLKEGASKEEKQEIEAVKALGEVSQALASTRTLLERMQTMSTSIGRINYTEDMVEEAKADPVIQNMTREMAAIKVDEESLLRQGYKDEHPTIVSLRNRYKANQRQQDDEMEKVLERIHSARVEDLRKGLDSLTARETQLIDELKETGLRKQDLLKAGLQVDQFDRQMDILNEEHSVLTAAKQNQELLSNNDVFDQIRIIVPAQTPTEVSFPKLAVMLPFGILLMVGLTASIVLLREIMDQRVKGPADVAMIPRLRVLGMVPDAAEDPARPATIETAFRDTPGGVVTESFRQIRSPVVKKMNTDGLRTCLVLAGMPGSGATTVASNLAIACASADEKILIIDANVRRPAMQRIFGIADPLGLADCLAGQITLADAVRPTSIPNLFVLTAGTPGNRLVPERLSSEAMSKLLGEAASGYDRVFIDSPPAIVSGDGMAIANRCDGVIMVVRALNEKRGLVNRVRAQLSDTRAELLGVVVNGVKASAGGYFKRNIQATHEYHNPANA